MKHYFLLVGLILTLSSPVWAAPNVSPWDAWRLGYTNFEKGEAARDQGNYTQALSAFKAAKEYYEAVKQRRPDWNQRVISERIQECEKECQKMQSLLGETVTTSKSDASPAASLNLSPLINDSKETQRLRQKFANSQAEISELRQKVANQRNYEQEITNLIRDQRIIREKYTLLLKRNRALEQQNSAPKTKLAELQRLLVEEKMKSDLKGRKLETTEVRFRELKAARFQTEQKLQLSREEVRRQQLEIANLRNKIELDGKNTQLQKSELEKLNRQIAAQLATAKEQKKSLAERDQELNTLREKYRQKLQSAGAGEKVNAKLLQENRQIQQERDKLRQAQEHLDKQIIAYQKQIADHQAAAEDLQNNEKKLQRQLAQLQLQLNQRQKELDFVRSNAKLSEIDLKKLREQTLSTERTIKELTQNNSELKKRLDFRSAQELKALNEAQTAQQKIQEARQKLENELITLRAEKSALTDQLNNRQKQLIELRSENRKLNAERINFQEKFKSISGAYENVRNLPQRYEELKRNFAALQAENRENRRAAEAAKPQAAELSQIKIRLLELDRLKSQLAREQRFNEELNAVKREQAKELKELRPMRQELERLRLKKVDNIALQKEVKRLRKITAELAEAQKLAPELAELKLKVARLMPQAAEAEKMRKQNAELRVAKSLWENEQSRLQSELTKTIQLRKNLAETQEKLATVEKQLAQSDQDKLRQKQQLDKLQLEIKQSDLLLKRHNTLIANFADLTEDHRKVNSRNQELKQEIQKLQKSDGILRKNNRELVDSIGTQAEKIEKLKQLLQASQTARNALEQSLSERDQTLKKLLTDSAQAQNDLQAQMLKKNQDLQLHIQKLKAAQIVLEKFWQKRAQELTSDLKQELESSLAQQKRQQKKIDELKIQANQLPLVQAELTAQQTKLKNSDDRYHKLLTEVQRGKGFSKQLKSLQQEIQKLNADNQSLRQTQLELRQNQKKLQNSGQRDARKLTELNQELQIKQAEIHQKEREINQIAIELQTTKSQLIKGNKLQFDQLKSQLKLAAEQNEALQKNLVSWQDKFTKLDRNRNQLGGQLGFVNTELEQLRKQQTELNLRLTTSRTENEALVRRLKLQQQQYATLQKLNQKNVNYEQQLAQTRQQNLLLQEKIQQLKIRTQKLTATEARLKQLQAQLFDTLKELGTYTRLAENQRQLKRELTLMRKLNKELSEAKLKADTALAQTTSKISENDRLQRELKQLRRLNMELAGAKLLEAELAHAKLRINRLEQLRDEIGRIRQLNENLNRQNQRLTQELKHRPAMPAFATESYQFSNAPIAKPAGKAEDYLNAGIIAAQDDSEELAIWNFKTALKINSHYPEASERLGRIYAARGDYALAAPLLSAARDTQPENVTLALDTASCYIALGRYGNAKAIIEPLRKRQPDNARLQLAAGQIAAGDGQTAKAANLMRIAINLAPRDPLPRQELARLLLNTDATRLEEAARLYESARLLGAPLDLELEPKLGAKVGERREMSNFLKNAAREAATQKDWNGAIWYYRQLIELGRNRNNYVPRLAYAQYKKGTPGAAVETLTMNTATALGSLTAATIHYQNKDFRAAQQALRQATALNGGKVIKIPADWTEFSVDFNRMASGKSNWSRQFRNAAKIVTPQD